MTKALSGVEHKRFSVELKADSPGEFEAVFSTLNVIDHDGDVTIPGAFKQQDVIISSYNHGSWSEGLPVGRGSIAEDDNDMTAKVRGSFFLSTNPGKDTYETVKAVGDLQEWSYGYRVVDAEFGQFQGQSVRFLKRLDVFEVSPVLRGAGIDTRLTRIKSRDGMTLAEHATDVLTDVAAFAARIKAVAALRSDANKSPLNDLNTDRLVSLSSHLEDVQKALNELLDATKSDDVSPEDVLRLVTDFQRIVATNREVLL